MALAPTQLKRLAEISKTIAIVDKFSVANPGPHVLEGVTLNKTVLFDKLQPAFYLEDALAFVSIGGENKPMQRLQVPADINDAQEVTHARQRMTLPLDPDSVLLEPNPPGNTVWSFAARVSASLFVRLLEHAQIVSHFRHPAFSQALGKVVAQALSNSALRRRWLKDVHPLPEQILAFCETDARTAQAVRECLLGPDGDVPAAVNRLRDAVGQSGIRGFEGCDWQQMVVDLRASLLGAGGPDLSEAMKPYGWFDDIASDDGLRFFATLSPAKDKSFASLYRVFRAGSDKLHSLVRFPLVSTACSYYYWTKFCASHDLSPQEKKAANDECYRVGVESREKGKRVRGITEEEREAERTAREKGYAKAREAWKQRLKGRQLEDVYDLLESSIAETEAEWNQKALPGQAIGRRGILERNLARFARLALRIDSEMGGIIDERKTFARDHALLIANAHRTVSRAWKDGDLDGAEAAIEAFKLAIPSVTQPWFTGLEPAGLTAANFFEAVESLVGEKVDDALFTELDKTVGEMPKQAKRYRALYLLRFGLTLPGLEDKTGRSSPVVIAGGATKGLKDSRTLASTFVKTTSAKKMLVIGFQPTAVTADAPPGTKVSLESQGKTISGVVVAKEKEPDTKAVQFETDDLQPFQVAGNPVVIIGATKFQPSEFAGWDAAVEQAKDLGPTANAGDLGAADLASVEDETSMTSIAGLDRKIVEGAVKNPNLARELRALTVMEYLQAAPTALTEFDQQDLSQQYGLMDDTVEHLGVFGNQGPDPTWISNRCTGNAKEGFDAALKRINLSQYVPANGAEDISVASEHWSAILNQLEGVQRYRDELNRVSDFVERSQPAGARVILINQRWDEYQAATPPLASLFGGEHQARVCYLGTEGGNTPVQLALTTVPPRLPGWVLALHANGAPIYGVGSEGEAVPRGMQVPVFVGGLPGGSVPVATPGIVAADEVVNLLWYAASLLHLENPEGFGGLSTDDVTTLGKLEIAGYPSRTPYLTVLLGELLATPGVRENIFYSVLTNLVLQVYGDPTLGQGNYRGIADALRKLSAEDLQAAFAGLPDMPRTLADLLTLPGPASLARDKAPNGDPFLGAGALWTADHTAPNGYLAPGTGARATVMLARPGYLLSYGML